MKTQTRLSQGAHIFSEVASVLGPVAGIVVHRSSQTEKQYSKLQVSLRRFTKYSSLEFRSNVISYGEARFWGLPLCNTDLGPELQRLVDDKVEKAKAA